MEQRIEYQTLAPEAMRAMLAIERYVRESGLEHSLLHLVKLRASQINGCAYCIDMHTKDARAAGETEQRLYLVSAWRESPVFSERERAALEWAEAVTLISEGGVPDELWHQTRRHFGEQEIADLTFALVAINGWNRLSVSFRPKVGDYQPGEHRAPTAAA